MRPAPIVVLALLLAGCTATSDRDATPPATDTEAGPRILADVSSQGCAYNDIVWLLPYDEVQGLLPTGFTARQEPGGHGAVVINAIWCFEGFAWRAWNMFITVDAPTWPPEVASFDSENRTPRGQGLYEIDLYLLGAHSDHRNLTSLLTDAGLEVRPGDNGRIRTHAQAASLSEGWLRHDGTTLASYTVEATGLPLAKGAHHRQWFQNATGTLLIERVWTGDGGADTELALGPAACEIDPTTLFWQVLGDRPCRFGQDILNGPEWKGRAYFFPGLRPT